jgi:lipid-binding SYLF domain-containing protein
VTILAGAALARDHHEKTLDSAAAVAGAFAAGGKLQSIPPGILCDAKAVAVIPHVVKGGVVVEGRFGRGVLLVHQPDGSWSHPVFITLEGGGVGLDAGVEATDLFLVFRSEKTVDRLLKGKFQLTLGSDAAVAVGPLGKEVEKTADVWRKAEVFCYSHSRGLFAGLALEGDKLSVDTAANEA